MAKLLVTVYHTRTDVYEWWLEKLSRDGTKKIVREVGTNGLVSPGKVMSVQEMKDIMNEFASDTGIQVRYC